MIHKFIEHKKFYDYINIKNIEVILTLCSTSIVFIALCFLDVHSNLNYYKDYFNSIIICVIGALIGLLAVLLAGVAFVSSLFTPDYVKSINRGLELLKEKSEINKKIETGEKIIERIMSSFVFISFHIGVYITYSIIIYFAINSTKPILQTLLFYFILFISLYMFIFIIFYTISLIYNCVDLNKIKSNFYHEYKEEKSIYDKANELRIDIIITTLLSNYNGDKKEKILDSLKEAIDKSNYSDDEKLHLKQYFENVYN